MSIYDACHMVGGMTADYWDRDPKRLAFVLARYKFVARMLEGKARVLEVGCADGFGSRIVRQHVGELVAIDIDPKSIDEAKRGNGSVWRIDFRAMALRDIDKDEEQFDAVYALDVLEHIPAGNEEDQFLGGMRYAAYSGVAIIGTPSLESQKYASELSRAGHVNCKSGADLVATLKQHWREVFLFSMSDETLHTGFPQMAHYLMALCVV